MTSQFLRTTLWNKITSLAKHATRKYVAVAYLGKNATKLLPLGQGDVLVVDVREDTVRAGQVNPFEIEEYLERGVEVYSCSNLHAKVFVFDRKAIIASANVSSHSKNSLVECGVLVTDAEVVSSARGFVMSLTGAPVTPAYVKSLKKQYHPPKIKGNRRSKQDTQDNHPGLWIERIYPYEFNKKENRLMKTGKAVARKRVRDKKKYAVDAIRYGVRFGLGQRATHGDLVIQIWGDEDEPLLVYPPSRIVHLKPYTTPNGGQRKLVFVEEPRNPNTFQWKVFRAAIRKLGVPSVSEKMGREIINVDQKQSILGLWRTRHKK
jgi:hypothetical protein